MLIQKAEREVKQMAKKGVPKRDGSGRGTGANAGRGGCAKPKKTRKGARR